MKDTVLLMAGDPDSLSIVHMQLRQQGCAVIIASDLVSAFSLVSRSSVDRIVTESRCPGGDVVQFIERIRRIRPMIKVIVIAIPGNTTPHSDFLNAGASSVIMAPVSAESFAALWNQPEQDSHPIGAAPKGRVIMIVEDDDEVRRGLGLRLKAHGYDPIFAPDGISAIRAAQQQQPDAVLLDLGLPAGDGFTVLHRLKEIAPWLPVIVLTGRDSDVNRERAMSEGARFFLTKPSTNEEILDCIKSVLVHQN